MHIRCPKCFADLGSFIQVKEFPFRLILLCPYCKAGPEIQYGEQVGIYANQALNEENIKEDLDEIFESGPDMTQFKKWKRKS